MPASHELPFHLGTGNVRINIRLDNFHFFHRPITGDPEEESDGKYIDRANPIHQVYNWIRYNYAQSGSYLVTGYRGAGKSSFVGMLMKKLEKDKEESGLDYISLSVNLGQENINEIEILRIIAKRLHGELLKRHLEEYHSYQLRSNLLYTSLALGGIFLGCTLYHLTDSSVGIYAIAAFLSFLLYGFLTTFRTSPIVRAINKLKSLTERLHASVQEEMTQNIGFSWEGILKTFSRQHKRTRDLPPATVQEIEYDLIAVLGLLRENNKKRKVIIIFDELDKADSGKQPEQAEDLPEFQKLSVRPDQKVSSRTRKQEVLRLIANMKYFLSSAQAYFIFIAGREMYEAYQADMSDRDFTISSIFSGVVNIDSFLTSSRNTNNSNHMTEQFVCKQILPLDIEVTMRKAEDEGYDRENIHSLRNCYYYWKQHPEDFYEDELTEDGKPDIERRKQRLWRNMLFLYHLVNYLTYICNGSPKKLTLFFEKNIRRKSYLLDKDKIKRLYCYRNGECVPENREEEMNKEIFYLSFGYYSQMKVNFIHYLTYPIMQSIISRSNQYGDKLLVSSSFIISHIFKLHNTGFSWRNLEQTPELLEINKTPEIREYISSIIDFMNHTHLTTIICGLFHYKFPMRIAEEISFHSKISGEISAIFNFSLDEMQNIKNHYARVLKMNVGQPDGTTRYSHASIHHSLGDIYMQEENYSDAIREYEKCMEIVAPIVSDLTGRGETGNFQLLNYLSFLNRTMLKLGLAHEKRRTDNSAFIIYEELIRILGRFKKEAQVLFDNMRTFHLALLAKLYVLEKIDTMGICERHLEEVFDGLYGFHRLFGKEPNDKFVFADFYRKLGDILYYKNRSFTLSEGREVNAESLYRWSLRELLGENSNVEATEEKNEICRRLCNDSLKIKRDASKKDVSEVHRDNYIYHMALCLEDLGHVALSQYKDKFNFDRDFLDGFLEKIQPKEEASPSEDSLLNLPPCNNVECAILYYWTAARLYNASCERGLSTNAYLETLYALLTYVRRLKSDEYHKVDVNLVRDIAKALAQHYLISRYRQYEHIHMSEQDLLRWMIGAEVYRFVEPGSSSISSDMEELISIFYTLELRLYKIAPKGRRETLLPELARFYHSDIMTGRHTSSTLTATVLNYKVKAKFDEQLLASLFGCNVEGLDEARLTDVAGMLYREVTDKMIVAFFDENSLKDINGKLDLLEALVIDGMFCLTRIAELVVPLRNSTLFNNSFKADVYVHLLRFNYLYRLLHSYYSYGTNLSADRKVDNFLSGKKGCCATIPDRNVPLSNSWTMQPLRPAGDMVVRQRKMSAKIRAALRREEPTYTYVCFLAENAIHYYTKARQVHSQGKSYQELIRNLFFLEDDLNNDTLQFYLALERFDIASKVQSELEGKLKVKYQHNPLYKVGQYFAHESEAEECLS